MIWMGGLQSQRGQNRAGNGAENKRIPGERYVLGEFRREERVLIDDVVKGVVDDLCDASS